MFKKINKGWGKMVKGEGRGNDRSEGRLCLFRHLVNACCLHHQVVSMSPDLLPLLSEISKMSITWVFAKYTPPFLKFLKMC